MTGGLGALSKVTRLALQSAVLGVGAYLVIHQQATAGVIIAGSIISGRALAPVDLAIANWRAFVAFRQSWARMNDMLKMLGAGEQRIELPEPKSTFSVENITLFPPGGKTAVVQDITFQLKKGSALGIVGPSAAGKSSLARALVGLWPPLRGKIRIDGAALDQWDADALGRHIGYLPQDVELLAGTVAQNIARFEEQPIRPLSSLLHKRQASMISSCASPTDTKLRSAKAARPCLLGSGKGLRLRGPSIAIPFCSFSTSRTPTSIPRAMKR